MKARHYRTALAKLRAGTEAPGVVQLSADECAALLSALHDLQDAAGRPPRFSVDTDPPGVMPWAATGAEMATEGE